MKKKLCLSSVILVGIGLFIVIFSGLSKPLAAVSVKPYTEIIKANWNISLPDLNNEIYSLSSEPSFQGDGPRYHVLDYKNSDTEKLFLNWNEERNIYIESDIYKITDKLNVSSKYMPDFSHKYKYYIKTKTDSSTLYLVFAVDSKKLYVIEDIY